MDRSILVALGNSFRRENDLRDWEVACGMCREWSGALAARLRVEGIAAEAVHGTYTSKDPDIGETTHWWVNIANQYIADVSVDQFESVKGTQWLRDIGDKRYKEGGGTK